MKKPEIVEIDGAHCVVTNYSNKEDRDAVRKGIKAVAAKAREDFIKKEKQMGCCLLCRHCLEDIKKDATKEIEFLERLLETKTDEHLKDIEALQGVIKSQAEEISRLKELAYP